VIGYLLGDGTLLKFGPQTLAQGVAPLCVSADRLQVHALGKRMARENLPPVPASGSLWLPAPEAAVFVDNREFAPSKQVDKMVVVGQ